MSKTNLGKMLCVVCALGGLAALTLRAADEPVGDAQPAAADAGGESRFFEMRTYHAAPGKLDALNARFRDHTLRLFKKHGIENVAYWTPADGDGAKNTLVYVLAYPDKKSCDASWKAFRDDPDWKKAHAESETSGPLVQKVEQLYMNPTDYSPLK